MDANMSTFERMLKLMSDNYDGAHGYVSITLCCYAFVALPIYIIVLLQPRMRTATNYILVLVAISDLVLCVLQFVYVIMEYFVDFAECSHIARSYEETILKVLNYNGRFTIYSISTWLCCLLAFVRYCILRKNTVTTIKPIFVAKSAIIIVLSTIVGLIPLYMALGPVPFTDEDCGNMTKYYVKPSILNEKLNGWPWLITRYSSGTLFKLIPCCILTTFIVLLVRKVVERNHLKRRLRGKSTSTTRGDTEQQPLKQRITRMARKAFRRLKYGHSDTTVLLIVILGIFLCTQFPQGVIIVISVVTDEPKYIGYVKNINELLSLLNSSISFLLYCVMNSQFRAELKRLFGITGTPISSKNQTPSRTRKMSVPGRVQEVPTDTLNIHNRNDSRRSTSASTILVISAKNDNGSSETNV